MIKNKPKNMVSIKLNNIECKQLLFELLGEYCGKTPKQVASDAKRDFWLNAKEALEYGIIDEIVKPKKK